MGVMRKLKRRGHSGHYKVEPLTQAGFFPARKLSEVLLDFAEPLLDMYDDDVFFESAICFAALCWNMSFLTEKEQRKELHDMADKISKSDMLTHLEMEDWAWMLLARKKAFFAEDRRIIIDYKIVQQKGRERLLVMSALTKDRPE